MTLASRCVCALMTGALLVGCGGDTPVAPPPPPPECERNRTAEITFRNGSSRSTYDILLDGVRTAVIGPGQSATRTVAAGQHTVDFIFSNTRFLACNRATPNWAQCSSQFLTCSTDL